MLSDPGLVKIDPGLSRRGHWFVWEGKDLHRIHCT